MKNLEEKMLQARRILIAGGFSDDEAKELLGIKRLWNRERDEKMAQLFYGCSSNELQEIQGGLGLAKKGSRARRYTFHKKNARLMGIDFSLTFPQWWDIWLASGHYQDIGRGTGQYCMRRIGNVGAFSPGNVEIVKNEINASDSYVSISASERYAKKITRLGRRLIRDEFGLTDRQRVIFDMFRDGKTNVEIAEALGLSNDDVKSRIWSIVKTAQKVTRESGALAIVDG